jgi:membrane protein implicated in regulation of membrane protease activity
VDLADPVVRQADYGRESGGYPVSMQVLPYWVTGAGVVAAVVIGVILGGWFWLLTAVAVVAGAIYVAGDRRLRRRESRGERLSADPRA